MGQALRSLLDHVLDTEIQHTGDHEQQPEKQLGNTRANTQVQEWVKTFDLAFNRSGTGLPKIQKIPSEHSHLLCPSRTLQLGFWFHKLLRRSSEDVRPVFSTRTTHTASSSSCSASRSSCGSISSNVPFVRSGKVTLRHFLLEPLDYWASGRNPSETRHVQLKLSRWLLPRHWLDVLVGIQGLRGKVAGVGGGKEGVECRRRGGRRRREEGGREEVGG